MFKKSGSLVKNAPDIPALHQMLNKCFGQPGEKLEIYWRSAENQTFTLNVIYSLKDRRPHWQLFSDKSGRRTLIADYSGHDILLIYKEISTSLSQALEERSGEESSRVSKTRDARAAATNWLDSKKDSGGEGADKKPGMQQELQAGLLSNLRSDVQHDMRKNAQKEDRPDVAAVSAALDESPWRNSPQAGQSSAPQSSSTSPPAAGASKSSAEAAASTGPWHTPQNKSANAPQSRSPDDSPAKYPDARQSNSSEPSQSKSSDASQSTNSSRSNSSASARSGSSSGYQSPESTAAMPPQAAFPPPAPVKVTSQGPQANAPKPLPANISAPKPLSPPTLGGKDRGIAHPDKGATGIDRSPSAQDKASPIKKHDSPEKITALPKIQAVGPARPSASSDASQAVPDREPAKPSLESITPAPEPVKPSPQSVKPTPPESGDLAAVSITKLLKQLKDSQITARLECVDDQLTAIVFTEEGKPVEAWMGELKGDSALLELLLWTSGHYSLAVGTAATNRNVKSTPEELLEHNKNIAALLEELAGEGLTATSTFAPSNPLLPSEDFDKMATPDAPMELEKLAKLYVKLDGKKTLAELNELHVLPRPALIEGIHHLYYSNIIDIVNAKPARKELVVTPKPLDGAAIQSVMMNLRRVDTGLFIYPAFLYFLQEEFYRIFRAKGSMSVLIFEMRELAAGDGLVRRVSLSSEAISDANMRISRCKRHTDLVAHYEVNDFAILLPSTGAGGTKVFANKVIKALAEAPLAGTEGKNLSFSFGAASMPEDFRDLGMLLGAAEMAMAFARQRGKPLVMFKEMEV